MNGYRLFSITKDKDGKETQGIYPGADTVYTSEDEAVADCEVRLGNAMKSDNTNLATYLMVMDDVGNAIRQSYIASGETEIQPRLIDIKASKTNGEKANMAKYDTVNDVHSNFHLKLGRAMQDADCLAIVLYGIDTHGSALDTTHWVRTYQPTETTGE